MHEKRERDRVTISLFSVETKEGFSDALLNQKDNIERMQKKMTDVAIAAGCEPPEFVVSVLLVPDWKKAGNGYENVSYKEKQAKFMETTRKHFSGVTVEDFYNKGRLTNSEKHFMNGLEALGSNADIIKNRAIINNQDRRHLQIDSNTQINDYYAFYAQTFGAPDEQQADALNASYYDKNTLSAHNKLVYSPPQPNGRIGAALEKHYVAFCEQNKNNNAAWMKGAGSNRIYTAFNKALESIGLVVGCRVPSWSWDFFRAKIEGNETIYRLTNTVVTAINMSWAAKPVSLNELSLKGVTVTVGDAVCDFQAFDYLIKKYCGRLWGKVEQDSGFANLSLEKNSTQIDPRASLIAISNEQSDLTVLASYYNEILEKHPEKIPLIVDKLKSINPSGGGENYNYDVKEANKLFQKLFHCTLEQFYSNPHQRAIVPPRIVTLEIPYEYGHDGKSRSHFHQVKYKGNEPDLQGKTGDALKYAILQKFKAEIEQCANPKDLISVLQKQKVHPDYQILATSQRITRNELALGGAGFKTSAIDAYEKMELSALKQMNAYVHVTARDHLYNKQETNTAQPVSSPATPIEEVVVKPVTPVQVKASTLSSYQEPKQAQLRIVNLEIPYKYGQDGKSRTHFHQAQYNGDDPELRGKTGDVLKYAILQKFKDEIERCTSSKELIKLLDEKKNSDEYKILAEPQRVTLKYLTPGVLGLKTSAIDAYEKMELSALKQMNVHIQLTARGLHNKPDSEPDIKPENDVQNSANSFKP